MQLPGFTAEGSLIRSEQRYVQETRRSAPEEGVKPASWTDCFERWKGCGTCTPQNNLPREAVELWCATCSWVTGKCGTYSRWSTRCEYC